MNWTAQHIGLGFTLVFLFGIFYRRLPVARIQRAKESDADKEVLQKQNLGLIPSSPSKPKGVQESSRFSISRKNKPRYSYPALRKYRAPSTLSRFPERRTKSLVKSALLTENVRQEVDDDVSLNDFRSKDDLEIMDKYNNVQIDKKNKYDLEEHQLNETLSVNVAKCDSKDSSVMISSINDPKIDELGIPVDTDAVNIQDCDDSELEPSMQTNETDYKDLQNSKGGMESEPEIIENNHGLLPEKLCNSNENTVLGTKIRLDIQHSELDVQQGHAPSAEQLNFANDYHSGAKDIMDDILKILEFENNDEFALHDEKANQTSVEKISHDTDSNHNIIKLDIELSNPAGTEFKEPIAMDNQKEKESCQEFAQNSQGSVVQDMFHTIPISEGRKNDLINDEKALQLQNLNLIEIPQRLMKHFSPNLKILNISSNYLETLPHEICYLTGVEFLYLRKNRLKKLPFEFLNMKSLQICDLAENDLEEIPHDTFSKCCDSLQILDLSKNQLIMLPYSLGILRSLRSLMLDNNCFRAHLKTLVEPLTEAYETGCPIKGHLFRIQGYLQDLHDIQSVPSRRVLPITSSRVPATSHLKLFHFEGNDLNQSKALENEKRRKIVQELCETEETYVQQLDDIYRLYMIPLSNFKGFSKIHYQLLFSNLDDIRYMHKRLILPSFRQIECLSSEVSIGKIFSSICPILMIYKEYLCNNLATSLLRRINDGYDEKISILDWLPLPETALNKFNKVQEAALLDFKHSQLNLASYLLLPVQRLPRYKLLLEALLHSTEENHPDSQFLNEAIHSFSQLLTYFNESRKETELIQEKTSLLYKLQIIPGSTLHMPSLLTPYFHNRKILQEFSEILILKYIMRKGCGFRFFMPLFLSSKKSQVTTQEKDDDLVEYKFKMVKDANMTSRQIEMAGPISKFNIHSILGKKCKIIVTTDLLLIANSNHELIGIISLPLTKRITIIPQTNSMTHVQGHPPQAVMRINIGGELMYLKGNMDQLNCFSNLIR